MIELQTAISETQLAEIINLQPNGLGLHAVLLEPSPDTLLFEKRHVKNWFRPAVSKRNSVESSGSLIVHENIETRPSQCANTIEQLDLSDKAFNIGVKATIRALRKCPNLITLNLHGNSLGDILGQQLLRLLPDAAAALRELDLSDNRLGQRSAKSIGQLLLHGGLRSLCISWNEFGPDGGRAICRPLTHASRATTLRDLRMAWCTCANATLCAKPWHALARPCDTST